MTAQESDWSLVVKIVKSRHQLGTVLCLGCQIELYKEFFTHFFLFLILILFVYTFFCVRLALIDTIHLIIENKPKSPWQLR